MRKKKALFFIPADVGGAERMSVNIAKNLNTSLFDVVFYILDSKNSESSIISFIPNGYIINRIKPSVPIRLITKYYGIIKKEKPDAVFSSLMALNSKLLLLKVFFPCVKFIVRCENYWFTYSSKQQTFVKLTYKLADVIIAQTEEMKQELVDNAEIGSSKIHVLQNPVDELGIKQKMQDSVNPYSPDGRIHFVASGRFVYQKGFDVLINAFSIVSKDANASLTIVGNTGGENNIIYKELKEQIHRLSLDKIVVCTGFEDNPYPYYANADCYVLSSRWEGLPNVLIEAMYLGTPAAAVKCIPVIERIISNGNDGYLAEPENPESLASAMKQAVSLGRICATYKSATFQDFQKLFD